MGTLSQYAPTLADLAKRTGPDGSIDPIAELLSNRHGIINDIKWIEGNLSTGHRTTIRTGLPTVAWVMINEGVQPTKSTTAQVDEACGIMESWSEVDERLVDLAKDKAAFRLSEAKPHIEAMAQEFASTLFYGTTAAPEEFVGLNARYASLSANNADNVISGSGSGSDNSSIYLINHGEDTFHGIYPKETKAGLQHDDYGVETVETTASVSGTRMRAYRERFQWKCGIALRDWRYVVRICNIDISNLVAESSAADLIKLMIKATHRIESLEGNPVFYMNRTCFQQLDIQRFNAVEGSGITWSNVEGQAKPSFRGIRIEVTDALTETEATVS